MVRLKKWKQEAPLVDGLRRHGSSSGAVFSSSLAKERQSLHTPVQDARSALDGRWEKMRSRIPSGGCAHEFATSIIRMAMATPAALFGLLQRPGNGMRAHVERVEKGKTTRATRTVWGRG
jgi:hypothetical protein